MKYDVRPVVFDALDLEKLDEFLASHVGREYSRRIETMLEDARRDCEKPGPDVAAAQGRCLALRAVIALPEVLKGAVKK